MLLLFTRIQQQTLWHVKNDRNACSQGKTVNAKQMTEITETSQQSNQWRMPLDFSNQNEWMRRLNVVCCASSGREGPPPVACQALRPSHSIAVTNPGLPLIMFICAAQSRPCPHKLFKPYEYTLPRPAVLPTVHVLGPHKTISGPPFWFPVTSPHKGKGKVVPVLN